MHVIRVALSWSGPDGVPTLFGHQLYLSVLVIGAGAVIGGGVGVVLGHTGRGSLVTVNAANTFRAVPTLALLTLLATWPPTAIPWHQLLAPFLALTVLAIPPILTNAYVGVREVDADVAEAARAMGLTGWQVGTGVELPLALPFIVAGIRTAAVEVIATSTLAAYTGFKDVGSPILEGLNSGDTSEALYGSLIVGFMAALVAILFGLVTRLVTPSSMRHRRRSWGLLVSAPAIDTPSPG